MISIYNILRYQVQSKILLLLSILLMDDFSVPAQSPSRQRDSLLKIISAGNGKVGSISALNALAKSYWNIHNDSAVYYADSARRLAARSGNIEGEAEGNRIIGVTNWYRERRPEEIKPFLDKSLELYKNTGNTKGIADTYNNLGSFWKYEGTNEMSLKYYDSSLVLYRKLTDKKGEAAVLNYIGIVYQNLGEFSKAIDYTLQGLMIRKTTNDDLGIVFSYLNVGNIFLAGGQPERAIRYYQDGIDYAHSRNMEPPPMAYNVMGKAYLQTGELAKAEKYLVPGDSAIINKNPDQLLVARFFLAKGQPDSAARYFQAIIENPGVNTREDRQAQAMAGLSIILKLKGNIQEAIEMANKSYATAGAVNKLTIAESAGILSELYEMQGQIGKSLSFLKIQHGILDSVTNRNYQNKLAYFETNAEMEKVQTRLQALSVQKALQEKLYKQEKLLRNFLIGISIVILMAAFFVIRSINARRKRILVQNELLDEQNKQVKKAYEKLQSAQAQLIQSEKMASLGELTAGIAHEIQNPLNFVNNFSELNQELISDLVDENEKGNTKEVRKISENIRDNEARILLHGKRADSIVKNMLQHSRASGSIKEPVDINALADEYLRLAYHGLRAKDKSFNAALHTDFDPGIGKINIIPQDIGRVLLNIYNNAFYAVMEKKKIIGDAFEPAVSVATKKINNQIEIRVKDNGMGIPQKVIDKIFQPFFTTKPTGQGTGLGLSLSYDIIKAHHGEFKVETREGEWTEFIIQLPII